MKISDFTAPQIFSAEIQLEEIREHGFIINPNGIILIKSNFDEIDQKALFYTWLLNSEDFRETWEEETGETIDLNKDIENTFLDPKNIKVDISIDIDPNFSTFSGFSIKTLINGVESYHNIEFEYGEDYKDSDEICNIDFNLRKQSVTFDLTKFIKRDLLWGF